MKGAERARHPHTARTRRPSLASDDGVRLSTAAEAFERLQPLLGGGLLLASDFDGTLARFGLDPWAARIIPTAQRALRGLAGRPDVHVALISGRTVSDLVARTRIGGISYHGDHGAERATARRRFRPAALEVTREGADAATVAMAEQLKLEVPRRVGEPWLVLEDKGPSLTFHFRGAPDTAAARVRVIAAVDAVDPGHLLVRAGGRRAHELRPAGATTKGAALGRLIDEHRPAVTLMLGDDHHDAEAFDVLHHACAAGRTDGLAIAVAGHAEVTRAVAPRADLVLAGPGEVARLLRLLARHFSPAVADERRPRTD